VCFAAGIIRHYYFLFSQVRFATVHEVLHADWQEAWHSPQPPLQALSFTDDFVRLFTCFIFLSLLISLNGLK